MYRRALLLGLYSIGGQVLLLRELVAALNGDELFISTALFGWLISVAIGAWLGGKKRSGPHKLFVPAAILLPVMIIVTRFSPELTGHMIGEVIPFTTAALISIVVMAPVGVISGWMFPAISRQQAEAQSSIVKVYLLEGIGAFVGGLVIAFAVGAFFSALMMAITISLLVIAVEYVPYGRTMVRRLGRAGLFLVAFLVIIPFTFYGASRLDSVQYRPYSLVPTGMLQNGAFDTHYGRQAILHRNREIILLTDNSIEAVYPDLNTAENLLVAPLVYAPSTDKIMYLGRPEYGLGELAEAMPGLSTVGLDPRQGPFTMQYCTIDDSAAFARLIYSDSSFAVQFDTRLIEPPDDIILNRIIHSDPVSYFSEAGDDSEKFDVVIINAGNLGSIKANRFLTPSFIESVRRKCFGVLLVHTPYDTDNHISADEKQILSTIYNVLKGSFSGVDVWPGTSTLFIASDLPDIENLPYDTIIARIDSLNYEPYYISADYLVDRLSDFKRDRLMKAITGTDNTSSLNKPQLLHRHLLYQSHVNSLDRTILSAITSRPVLMALIAVAVVLALFVGAVFGARRRFGLFMFFAAGVVSLSLELIVFYTFQSMAGALYSQMAMLIGAFMLGLAVGTYLAHMIKTKLWGYFGLLILLLLTIGFALSWESFAQIREQAEPILIYHMLFLFVAAVATGTLFVAATRRYYGDAPKENRGTGYAYEIAGSSVGALFTTAVLLPAVGLNVLLIGIAGICILTLVGLIIRR